MSDAQAILDHIQKNREAGVCVICGSDGSDVQDRGKPEYGVEGKHCQRCHVFYQSAQYMAGFDQVVMHFNGLPPCPSCGQPMVGCDDHGTFQCWNCDITSPNIGLFFGWHEQCWKTMTEGRGMIQATE